MNRLLSIVFLVFWGGVSVDAQRVLTLDSCRALALRNNKALGIARVKQDVAKNIKKSARTKYLPHVSAFGGYEWTSKEISLLNDDQKETLSHLGTSTIGSAQQSLAANQANIAQMLSQLGVSTEQIGALSQQMIAGLGNLSAVGNTVGNKVIDAFRTDTRNVFAGSVMVTQPIFMGGSIIAMNKLADLGEQYASNSADSKNQAMLYNTDQAYWTIVSLKHKKRLAESFLSLVKKLDGDVAKMIKEGVATRSEGLSVNVKVNEAEMALTQVSDGLVLAKMYLCQLCGLPMRERIILSDEDKENLDTSVTDEPIEHNDSLFNNRPELRMLQNMVDMSKQTTNILKAGNLPKIALTGGYLVSNPNLYNGFEKKFSGTWNVGVLIAVPVWNWGDVTYKVRASKGATTIASLELTEAREKIELQVNQSSFKVDEAKKRLAMAKANTMKAEENLRSATLGFKEGVIQSTTVMEAQTAWLQAQSQKIDAEIDVKLSQVNLQKALGILQ